MSKFDTYIVGNFGFNDCSSDMELLAASWGVTHFLNAAVNRYSNYGDLDADVFGFRRQVLPYPQRFRGQNRLIHWRNAFYSNRIVFAGGNTFHRAKQLNLYRQLMKLANSNEHYAIGIQLGAFSTKADEVACRKFLYDCAFVGIGDPVSFERANDIAPNANLLKTFNLAPTMLNHPDVSASSVAREGIGINICPNEFGHHDKGVWYEYVAKLIEAIWTQMREPVTLIEWDTHSARHHSVEVNSRLSADVPIDVLRYQPDPLMTLASMSRFKAVLGMKTEACLYASLVDTPVLALSQLPPCDIWCDQVGVPLCYRVDPDQAMIHNTIDLLDNGLRNGFLRCGMDIETMISDAFKNWSYCYEYANDLSGYPAIQQRGYYR